MAAPAGPGSAPRSYRALKWLAWVVTSVFYRRVDVTGASRLPRDRPAIIAANHTNALADPVVLVGKVPGLPRFLAASSLWKFASARLLFRLAGVVPIHRRPDGADTEQNTSTFAECHAALADGAQLAIFPEGEVHVEPALLPLKTGTARIALGAAADADVRGIAIVPVGLVYDQKGRFRSQAAVQIGEPIEVDPWVDRYRADSTAAVRAVTDVLACRLREVTVNHASWREAAVVERAAALAVAGAAGRGPGEFRFARRTALRHALACAIARAGGEEGSEFRELEDAVGAHARALEGLGIENPNAVPNLEVPPLARRVRVATEVAVLTPFGMLGIATNGPVVLAVRLVSSRVGHGAWQATAKGLTAFVLCPLVWTLESVFAFRRFGRRAGLCVLAAGPIGGLGWIAWRARWLRWRRMVHPHDLEDGHGPALAAARESREAVRERVETLVGAATFVAEAGGSCA